MINSLFLSIFKVNTKSITTTLCMALVRLLCICPMLEMIYPFLVITIHFPKSKRDYTNLILFILLYLFVPPKQSVAHMPFLVIFIVSLIAWLLFNTNITFASIICAWMAIHMETLIGRKTFMSMLVHALLGKWQGS